MNPRLGHVESVLEGDGGPHPEGALRGPASHPGAPLVQDVSPEPVEDT